MTRSEALQIIIAHAVSNMNEFEYTNKSMEYITGHIPGIHYANPELNGALLIWFGTTQPSLKEIDSFTDAYGGCIHDALEMLPDIMLGKVTLLEIISNNLL